MNFKFSFSLHCLPVFSNVVPLYFLSVTDDITLCPLNIMMLELNTVQLEVEHSTCLCSHCMSSLDNQVLTFFHLSF